MGHTLCVNSVSIIVERGLNAINIGVRVRDVCVRVSQMLTLQRIQS